MHLTIDVGSHGQTTGLVYASRGATMDATFILGHGAAQDSRVRSSPILRKDCPTAASTSSRSISSTPSRVVAFRIAPRSSTRVIAPRLLQPDAISAGLACSSAASRWAAASRRIFAAGDDAEQLGIRGVVALGYPLHPPGKPQQLRAAHLSRITCRC
jgi:hypothetical protein